MGNFFEDAWDDVTERVEGWVDDPIGQYEETFIDPVTDFLGGGDSAQDAVDAQERASQSAVASERAMYDQTRADLTPWREAGGRALSELERGDFAQNLQMDPGYQFRLAEGRKALQGGASARGNLQGGATMKALTRYGQDYASQEYGNAYNREYNRLSQLAGFGGSANAQQAQGNMQFGTNLSNIYTNQGNANAAAAIAQGNQRSQLFGQGLMAAGMYFSDSTLKEGFEKIPEKDMKEMKKHLRAFYYDYKDKEHGQGKWAGVMAEDLQKSKVGRMLVSQDKSGVLFVDSKKVMSMFLATMAEGA